MDGDAGFIVSPGAAGQPGFAPDAPGGLAEPAATRRAARRRFPWGMVSFLLVAILPTLIAGVYLVRFASDQYLSEFRFSVRQAQPLRSDPGMSLPGLSAGNPLLATLLDSEIVVQYIASRQILDDLQGEIDLPALYADPAHDWLARLDPAASAEARLRYWKRMVDPYFDMATGLVTVKVRGFTPDAARQVADAVLRRAERLVNSLSERARTDKLAYADSDVAEKEARLKQAELKLSDYRNTHGVLFPSVHANENATVDTQMRDQLAQLRTTSATLRAQGVPAEAPPRRGRPTRLAAREG